MGWRAPDLLWSGLVLEGAEIEASGGRTAGFIASIRDLLRIQVCAGGGCLSASYSGQSKEVKENSN